MCSSDLSPGVWEMVPENTGCYSVRGLESWEANTSYLAYGAELDHPAWSRHSGISVAARDGVWEIMRNRVSVGGVYQDLLDLSPVEPEAWTASCVMKAGTSSAARLVAQRGAGWPRIQLTENWDTYSVTNTVQPGQLPGLVVGPDEDQKSILVAGCWLTRTSTPGRACWGGEAPVTCAADRHTISTEGWPTEAGEVSFIYTPGTIDDESKYFVSAMTYTSVGWEVYVRFGSPLAFMSHASGSSQIVESDPLTWETRPYHIRVRWRTGEVVFWRDGVEVGRGSLNLVPAGPLPSTARIGRRESSGGLNGSIRSLTVRSYEEVSP